MPCPWYINGLCTSPKLGEPTDSVTDVRRCASESEYAKCAYYVDPRNQQRRAEKLRPYAPIHAIPQGLSIGCPYSEILTLESGLRVAYCKILGRLLTRTEAQTCAMYWNGCPYKEHYEKISGVSLKSTT